MAANSIRNRLAVMLMALASAVGVVMGAVVGVVVGAAVGVVLMVGNSKLDLTTRLLSFCTGR